VTDDPGQEEDLGASAPAAPEPEATDVSELIALIDRLEPMLEASGLEQIEIASGDTMLVLRAHSATAAPTVIAAAPVGPPAAPIAPATPAHAPDAGATSGLRQVKAPLTGLFYLSPSPGAAAYVKVDREVIAGQVIGLLEAMKLFNEIKSDVTGVVRRIVAENGALVKTHQVLIEVEPT
jgi:acetyl-CoA carboxylase biotin carboxyl carrier protein